MCRLASRATPARALYTLSLHDALPISLLEEGEHGYLAARVAAQVIKAYVDKQRRTPSKMAHSDGKVEIGGVWNAPDPDGHDTLHGGRFVIDANAKPSALAAAAPGTN